MAKKRLVIIGAGPTGLGAAYRLNERKEDIEVIIIDDQGCIGGLAGTRYCDDGFSWDLGGHVVFSNFEYFNKVMDRVFGEDLLSYKRNAFVYMMVSTGEYRWIPFPIQRNIDHLPIEDRDRIKNDEDCEVVDFETWMMKTFGKHLTSIFMRPYNKKVWTVPGDKMNIEWVKDRVASKSEESKTNWGPNADYKYPKSGGTGAIWKKIGESLPKEWFMLGERVTEIDYEKKKLIISCGKEMRYDYLITTIPLPRLSVMTGIAPETKDLRHTATHIVGIGFRGEMPGFMRSKSWIYFPGVSVPFYRVTPLSQYAGLAPQDHFSMLCECADDPAEVRGKEVIVDSSIKSLCLLFNLDENKVASIFYEFLPYGYPIPTLERNEILKTAIPKFEAYSIYSRGRFGGYKYEIANQDHSFMQGVEVVDYIFDGKPCSIYRID